MESKSHAVIIPFPSQEHVDPMLNFAKILHAKGFHITFVHSEYNYQRLLKSRGPSSLDGLPDFRFETFPDGFPSMDIDRTKDLPSLLGSVIQNSPHPIHDLIVNLNNTDVPPITCIISDNVMSFTLDVAKEIRVPISFFWATSACGLLGYLHLKDIVGKGLAPLKDESDLVNGYLDARLDWIPGMSNVRLKDMSTFIRTTDANDFKLNFAISEANKCSRATSIIINTFYDLDSSVLEALSSLLPPVYEIGPLDLLCDQMIHDHNPFTIESMGSNLLKEDPRCLEWLDTKKNGSVVYVYVECITMMTDKQRSEFTWGLCNSNKDFMWITSPEDVTGNTALLPEGFLEETKKRSIFSKWCSQKDVLNHPSVGGLVTNCYYKSTFEAICGGVPMLCLPIFGEQMTNCRYSCMEWGVGLEIDNDVKREEVSTLITELMDGEKGKEMRANAKELKAKAIAATQKGGTSFIKMEKLANDLKALI